MLLFPQFSADIKDCQCLLLGIFGPPPVRASRLAGSADYSPSDRLYCKRRPFQVSQYLEGESVLEELKQQLVHSLRFLVRQPVGGVRKVGELCGVTVLQTVLCHLGKQELIPFAP
jgi:hypothetical protein